MCKITHVYASQGSGCLVNHIGILLDRVVSVCLIYMDKIAYMYMYCVCIVIPVMA